MKVLFAINSLEVGGAQRVFVNQVNELIKDPVYDVWVLTAVSDAGKKNFRPELALAPEKSVAFNFKKVLDFKGWLRAYRFLKKEHFDAVVSYLFLTNFVIRILAKLTGVKAICSYEQNVYLHKNRRQIMADHWLAKFTDAIFPVSNAVLEFTAKQENIAKEKFRLVHNAALLEKYELSESDKAVFKTKLGIPLNALIIGNAGSLVEQKGQSYFIKAAKLVLEQNTGRQIYFLIAGEGKLRPELEKLAQETGIRETIKMPGIVPINEFFSIIDVFAMPSLYEGLSLVMLEAMVYAKPVIMSDVSGAREVLTDQVNGLIVPVKNEQALAEAMGALAANPELRKNLGEAAEARVVDFSISKNVALIKKILNEIINSKD